ncbi:hypothetical protein [Yinghuangia soli]|uniref:Uncharacterized protein n=1 Tax=Yinghuangia soli TaxID=2908204 RepID=A0AA41PYK7_9ACTN|nr:hypothetical protein [Yinghuangia soli]MCF2526857.1 hypothetical protein [Yinghuangia soli]
MVLVGLLVSVASMVGIVYTVMLYDNTMKEAGWTETGLTDSELPGPRGLGADFPPATDAAGVRS